MSARLSAGSSYNRAELSPIAPFNRTNFRYETSLIDALTLKEFQITPAASGGSARYGLAIVAGPKLFRFESITSTSLLAPSDTRVTCPYRVIRFQS